MQYTEWYQADGIIIDRLNGHMWDGHWGAGDWLCLVNPDGKDAHITITVFFEDLPPRSHSLTLGARRARNLALHGVPGLLERNKQYGLRVRSNVPILAQSTRGEYEPDDPVTNAMGSTILTPGPLTDKDKELWYVDGIILTGGILEESEWLSVLNPNQEEARIELTIYYGDREPGTYSFSVPPERVHSIKMDDLEVVPKNSLFSVRIKSNVPVAAEEVRRAYEKGHYSCARSMFTVMCIPAHID